MTQAPNPDPTLALDLRSGLPDALRVLLAEYPRDQWDSDPGFDGLVRFWLDRHMMFRRILERLTAEAKARHAGVLDPQRHAHALGRLGSSFVGELHGHHSIEDAHYFPTLATKDARVARGFDLLDADHHALDTHLAGFVDRANAVLQAGDAGGDAVDRLIDGLAEFERFLDRHLIDEEELVVPVILNYGTDGLG